MLRLLVLFLIVAAVVSVGGYMWLRSYLAGPDFRKMIVTQAEKTLRADSTLSPLRWDGFRVNTDSFQASGSEKIKEISLEGIKTGIDASGVTRGVWSVLPSRIGMISATYDMTAPAVQQEPEAPQAPVAKAWYDAWIPKKVETNSLIVSNTHLTVILPAGPAELTGTQWEVDPMDGLDKAKFRALGGAIQLPFAWAPKMELDRMVMTYQSGYLYLTNSNFGVYANGHLDLAGECDLTNQRYSFEGSVRDVLCNEVMPEDWKQRLSGKIDSSFSIHSSSDSPVIKGHVTISQGSLTALPVLDKLAAYSQSLRFRTLTLHAAECDFEWTTNRVVLTNVKLGSEGLARMEGKVTFSRSSADEPFRMDGDFMVGLAPGTLSQIPGAEEDVFMPGERGLLWAPMHLSGTLDDPKEDLSERLMAAAGARMFDIIPATGLKVLKYTQDVVGETGIGTVEKAVDATKTVVEKTTDVVGGVADTVKTGTDAVKEVGSVVEGVLDIFGKPKVEPEKPVVPEPPVPQVPKVEPPVAPKPEVKQPEVKQP